MTRAICYYGGLLVGAYVILIWQATGITVHWWMPLAWVLLAAILEYAIRLRLRRRPAMAIVNFPDFDAYCVEHKTQPHEVSIAFDAWLESQDKAAQS